MSSCLLLLIYLLLVIVVLVDDFTSRKWLDCEASYNELKEVESEISRAPLRASVDPRFSSRFTSDIQTKKLEEPTQEMDDKSNIVDQQAIIQAAKIKKIK